MTASGEFSRGWTITAIAGPSAAACSITVPAVSINGIGHVLTDVYAQLVTLPWNLTSRGVNVVAAVSRVGNPGIIHVCTAALFQYVQEGSNTADVQQAEISDGGTAVWRQEQFLDATSADEVSASFSGLLSGATGNGMTIGYTGVLGTGTVQTVNAAGFDTTSLTPAVGYDIGNGAVPLGYLDVPGKSDYTLSNAQIDAGPDTPLIVEFLEGTASGQFQYLQVQGYDK